MTQLLVDDFTGTNGASPDTNKWFLDASGGDPEIQSNQVRMEGSGWSGLDGLHTPANHLYIEGTFQWEDTVASSVHYIGFSTRQINAEHTGYQCYILNDTGGLEIRRVVNGSETVIAFTSGTATTAARKVAFEREVLVSSVELKLWIWDPAGSKPGTPTLSFSDTNAARVTADAQGFFGAFPLTASRFLDCDEVAIFDLAAADVPDAPTNLQASGGNALVDLTWDHTW